MKWYSELTAWPWLSAEFYAWIAPGVDVCQFLAYGSKLEFLITLALLSLCLEKVPDFPQGKVHEELTELSTMKDVGACAVENCCRYLGTQQYIPGNTEEHHKSTYFVVITPSRSYTTHVRAGLNHSGRID